MGGFGTQEENSASIKKSSDHCGKPFPQRRHLSSQGIAIPDQEIELMGQQNLLALLPAAGPPPKTAPGQPLLAKPKPLTVIGEDFYGRGPLIAKDKHHPRERIGLKDFPAYRAQSIKPPPEVHRFDHHPDPDLGRNLDHRPWLQKARLSSNGSKSLGAPFKERVIFVPLGASISTLHSEAGTIGAPRSSFTNPRSGPNPASLILCTRFLRP